MAAWTSEELDKVSSADELHIAPEKSDGSLRHPIPIWVVRDGDDLFVRAVNGPNSAWFRTATRSRKGHIRAGGVDKDVEFSEVDPSLSSAIDADYRAKYQRYPKNIVDTIVSPGAREATLKLVPR